MTNIWLWLTSGYNDTIWLWLTVRHGKSTHAIKNSKPSISMGHLYHGYVTNNQRVKYDKYKDLKE